MSCLKVCPTEKNEPRKFSKGDLVTQGQNHKSQVGCDWGIGTVVRLDGFYIKVFWPHWGTIWSMSWYQLEIVDV
tara:strand:+ start:297 stop:518 length:222 start_codon:yes stop_codon:yes gene_type:complete